MHVLSCWSNTAEESFGICFIEWSSSVRSQVDLSLGVYPGIRCFW